MYIIYVYISDFIYEDFLFYEGFFIFCLNFYREYVLFKYCNNVIVLFSGLIYLYVYHICIYIV